LESGAAVADACRHLGYQVYEADILPDDASALRVKSDVVFPVLHGFFGEDGQLQELLEQLQLCYVGSDPAASRLAMDKDAAKRIWQQAELPTAPWRTFEQPIPLRFDGVRFPAVVKPVSEGSSIGVSFCETENELREAVLRLLPTYGKVIVEQRLTGMELTVGILGNAPLPIVQIKPAAGFYDYAAKYDRDDTQYLLEPEIDATIYRQVQQIALEAFRLLGCRDYGRVDLIVDETLGLQLLEVNTIPGFTSHSLLPKAAKHAGIDLDRLVDTLIQRALFRVQ
jgi:D-alanine-D-alanine ligase